MAFTAGLCTVLQTALRNVAGQQVGNLTRQQTGFTDLLVSPENRRGFQQITFTTPNGGRRKVAFTYQQAAAASDIVTTRPGVCAGGAEVVPFEQELDPADMSERWSSAMLLSETEMQKICSDSPDEYRAQMIMGRINELMVQINNHLLTLQAAQMGDFFASGNAAVAAPLIFATGNAVNYAGWINSVSQNLKNIRVNGRPLVTGAGTNGIYLYTRLGKVGCCNNYGIDVSQADNDMAYFYDQSVDTIFGANQFIAVAPGALQLITYTEYDQGSAYRRIVPGDYEHDFIIDPFTGLKFDFDLSYDKCDRVWRFAVGLRYYLWALPNDMYPAGDMNGVRNTLRFTAVPA